MTPEALRNLARRADLAVSLQKSMVTRLKTLVDRIEATTAGLKNRG